MKKEIISNIFYIYMKKKRINEEDEEMKESEG